MIPALLAVLLVLIIAAGRIPLLKIPALVIAVALLVVTWKAWRR